MNRPLNVMMVAGEASADLHGAALLRELKVIHSDLNCFGVGGRNLAAEGMEIEVEAHAINIVGVTGWMDKLSTVLRSLRQLKRLAKTRKPDLAILLDLPDFNLNLAKYLRKLGIPVVYYISPQVWAWRTYRVNRIRRDVKKMLVLFPFEKTFYEAHGVAAEFVGHPLLDHIRPRTEHRSQSEVLSAPRISLLPGSRGTEIKYHVPLLKTLVDEILRRYPGAQFRVPIASTVRKNEVESLFANSRVELIDGHANDVMAWGDIAVVASGTATLETALVGTPFSLIYKVSASNAFVFHHVFRYKGFIGMPNLLLGREVIKEFFQEKATPERILPEVFRMIEEESYRTEMANSLALCRTLLGTEGASRRAALQVFQALADGPFLSGLSFAPTPA